MKAFSHIRTYLVLIAGAFSLMAGAHIALVYIGQGALVQAQTGGTLSVGFVGSQVNLNPLAYGSSPENDLAMRFLFRGILHMNSATRTAEGDLGTCDLSSAYSSARCILKSSSVWNDGSAITKDDILSTFATLRDSDVNPRMREILKRVTIEDGGDSINFSMNDPSSELLDVLSFPIVSKSLLASIASGSTTSSSGSLKSSGSYELSWIETLFGGTPQETKKILLVRSENLATPEDHIGRFAFLFFPDATTLAENESSLNAFVNPSGDFTPQSPRLQTIQTLHPEYAALFVNTQNITSQKLRALLLSQVMNTKLPSVDTKQMAVVRDVFMGTGSIHIPVLDPNFVAVMRRLGYARRESMESLLREHYTTWTGAGSGKITTLSGVTTPSGTTTTPQNTTPVVSASSLGQALTYITTPANRSLIVTGDVGGITIQGNVPVDVSRVFINNYPLQSYTVGSGKFVYNAQPQYGNYREGENTYTLAFERGGNRTTMETLRVWYIPNETDRTAKLQALIQEKQATLSKPVVPTTTPSQTIQSTPNTAKLQAALAKIPTLDDHSFYNADLVPYKLKIVATNRPTLAPQLAQDVAQSLETLGIQTDVHVLENNELSQIVNTGNKSYDLIVTGINTGPLASDLFAFFHSGQADKGFNFGRLKDLPLDVELESLRKRMIEGDRLESAKSAIRDRLGQSASVLPLVSPYTSLFVDRNIENFQTPPLLPDVSDLADFFRPTFIKKERIFQWSDKSIIGFFRFLGASW